MLKPAAALFALIAAGLSAPALAHDYAADAMAIEHPWARVTMSKAQPGAVYFVIENSGKTADRLLSATAERAKAVEIHESVTGDDGVTRMRPITDGIEIPAGGSLALESGGAHIMLIGLDAPLKEGEKFPLVLTFEKAGAVDIIIHVENRKPSGEHHHH